jgi:transcriptional antiterminator NusG
MEEAKWYVVHTFSGYENKVKADLEKTIENRNLQDQIMEVTIPLQEVTENRDGEKKTSMKKLFPAYVLVHMILNDDTWYVVRNTRGVTGFVGPGSKPVPLTEEEMAALGGFMGTGVAESPYKVGDYITVVQGAWQGTTGMVHLVNDQKQTVTIYADLFGRETPVELNFTEVKKV